MDNARKGIKLLIIAVFISIAGSFIGSLLSIFLPSQNELNVLVGTLTILFGLIVGGVVELIGYFTAGKDCHYFANAFRWQIFSIVCSVTYYVLTLALQYNKTQNWIDYTMGAISTVSLLIDVATVWCLGRGCVEVTDDNKAVTTLADVALILTVISSAITVTCSVFKRINTDVQSVMSGISTIMLFVSEIIQVILIIMAYKNIVVFDEA